MLSANESYIVRVESLFERDGVAFRNEAADFPHFYELRCLACVSDLPVVWGPGACPPKPRRELYDPGSVARGRRWRGVFIGA